MDFLKDIKYDEKGLIPAIIQDALTGEVLMMAYMNEESLKKSVTEKETYFFSRSRQELWHKGGTSGNTQKIIEMKYDCDGDTLLVKVIQKGKGVACHTGEYSCFFKSILKEEKGDIYNIIDRVYRLILERKETPKEGSYTNYLFEKGIDKILKKVGEENAEVIIGAKNKDNSEVIYEVSDLVYHVLVLLVELGIDPQEIKKELENRYS